MESGCSPRFKFEPREAMLTDFPLIYCILELNSFTHKEMFRHIIYCRTVLHDVVAKTLIFLYIFIQKEALIY